MQPLSLSPSPFLLVFSCCLALYPSRLLYLSFFVSFFLKLALPYMSHPRPGPPTTSSENFFSLLERNLFLAPATTNTLFRSLILSAFFPPLPISRVQGVCIMLTRSPSHSFTYVRTSSASNLLIYIDIYVLRI